jgi:hypothetical protein
MDFVSVVADGTLDVPTSATVSRVISAHNAVLERHNAFNAAFDRRLHAEPEKSGLVAVMISPSVARNAVRGFWPGLGAKSWACAGMAANQSDRC